MQAFFSGFAWAALLLTQLYLDENGLPLAWFGVVLAGLHVVAFIAAFWSPRIVGLAGRQAIRFVRHRW